MTSNWTLNYVRDKFIEIEKKYDVYSLTVNGVYFWKLIRFDLFSRITKDLKILNEGHPLTKKDKVKRFFGIVKYGSKNLWLRTKVSQADVMLLSHGRKSAHGNIYVDPYLYDIQKMLEKNKETYLVIDRPDHYGKHYEMDFENYIYFERFGHVVRELMYKPFSGNLNLKNKKNTINIIQNEINSVFNVDIDLTNLIKKKIFRFMQEKKYFLKLLKKVKPKKIYLVVSYGKEELISAAEDLGIETIEVQHGVISNYHFGYYFPYDFRIPYFPSRLVLFGKYWKDSAFYPNNCTLETKSFSLLNMSEYVKKFEEKQESVVFISQGSIGEKLSQVAAEFANNNNINCYYKLHPSEYNQWKLKYKELFLCEKQGKIKVISNQETIYELFSKCKYSIGVYSTSIFESLLYECETFLTEIEGYQYMQFLIDNNYVKVLPKNFSICDLKDFKSNKAINVSYFYMNERIKQ
ncbi:MAG TPA: hypothetical protein DER56_04710 [Thermosipho africanus]|nr:hypothetical protein [Thermosipho africanus]